jgi:DNA transformation protein and related proteins
MTASKFRSLRNSESFRQFVLDQLEPIEVRAQSMFGGVGLYSGEFFFGIIAQDRLFLKVDATTQARYIAAKMKPFRPYADRPGSMHYYEVPLSVLESCDELERWAREAVSVARRAAAARSATRARPATSTVRPSRARTRQR